MWARSHPLCGLGEFLVLTRHAMSVTLLTEWPTTPRGYGTGRWPGTSAVLRLSSIGCLNRFRGWFPTLLGVNAQPEPRLGRLWGHLLVWRALGSASLAVAPSPRAKAARMGTSSTCSIDTGDFLRTGPFVACRFIPARLPEGAHEYTR